MRCVFKWYVLIALTSMFMAGIWHNMRFSTLAPQTFGIHFYQRIVGAVDGRSCPSYPVCSQYARQAFQTHGWLIGSWLMIDRLIHEADDLKKNLGKGHIIVFEGEMRLYDPLSRNDFWLSKE